MEYRLFENLDRNSKKPINKTLSILSNINLDPLPAPWNNDNEAGDVLSRLKKRVTNEILINGNHQNIKLRSICNVLCLKYREIKETVIYKNFTDYEERLRKTVDATHQLMLTMSIYIFNVNDYNYLKRTYYHFNNELNQIKYLVNCMECCNENAYGLNLNNPSNSLQTTQLFDKNMLKMKNDSSFNNVNYFAKDVTKEYLWDGSGVDIWNPRNEQKYDGYNMSFQTFSARFNEIKKKLGRGSQWKKAELLNRWTIGFASKVVATAGMDEKIPFEKSMAALHEKFCETYQPEETIFNQIKQLPLLALKSKDALAELHLILINAKITVPEACIAGSNMETAILTALYEKLDSVILNEWKDTEKMLKPTDSKIPIFAKFIHQQERVCTNKKIESVESDDQKQMQPLNKGFTARPSIKHSNSRRSSRDCNLHPGKHSYARCPQYLRLNADGRLKKAINDKRCLNCLRFGHTWSQCRSRYCSICGEIHNDSLHDSKIILKEVGKSGEESLPPNKRSTLQVKDNKTNDDDSNHHPMDETKRLSTHDTQILGDHCLSLMDKLKIKD